MPGFAGDWVVVCDGEGKASQAIALADGRTVPVAMREPLGLGPGVVVTAGPQGALLDLERGVRTSLATSAPTRARPATDGLRHAWVTAEGLVEGVGPTFRTHGPSAAREAPAVGALGVVWRTGAGELWWVPERGRPGPLPGTALDTDIRLPVASSQALAFVEEGRLVLARRDGSREVVAFDAGFQAPATLWWDVACWEERVGPDLDIRCSDGTFVGGPGHQEWPRRHEGWLIVRDRGVDRLLPAVGPWAALP